MRLAGHLKKTLAEIDQMSCDEFALWQAWSHYHVPFDSGWETAAMLATWIVAPYVRKGNDLKPADFIPVMKAPQAQSQINETLEAISKDLQKNRT